MWMEIILRPYTPQNARTIQVDMVGYREVGDFRSLSYAALELLGNAVDALLAAHHITNLIVKWRSRLLEFLPSDWESKLAYSSTGLAAPEFVWALSRLPPEATETATLAHAFQIADFARAVFFWAESSLPNNGVSPLKRNACTRSTAGFPSEHLDFDVDFWISDAYVRLARLNEFAESTELTLEEFLTILGGINGASFVDGSSPCKSANLSRLRQLGLIYALHANEKDMSAIELLFGMGSVARRIRRFDFFTIPGRAGVRGRK